MISAIVPMRNEERNAEGCLKSLKAALEESGQTWEIVVVDDASHDATPSMVERMGFVKLVRVDEKPEDAVGKNYALLLGYRESKGDILLFLDADVRLSRNSLRELLKLFEGVDMLSVSPEQLYGTPWEASLQPMIFKLLGYIYPLEEVSDPDSPVAAANGQFIMIKREVYEEVGTHEAVMNEILEDVRLAERVKGAGFRLLFLHGKGYGVKARMYTSLESMLEGWAKNLVPLLRGRVRLGLWYGLMNMFESLTFWTLSLALALNGSYTIAMGVFLIGNLYFAYRFKRHHAFYSLIHSSVGSVLFLFTLYTSWSWYRRGKVVWRGREYAV